MHLIGLHPLIGVHLIGILLIGVHLTYRRASHRYTPMSEVSGSIRARSCSEPNMRAEYASLLRGPRLRQEAWEFAVQRLA
jgi:hypothetical protein